MKHLSVTYLSLMMTLFLCHIVITPVWAWQDGDTIYVSRDKNKMIVADSEELASLNMGFSISKNGKIKGYVHILNDTMIVDYIEDGNLIKKESYRLDKNGNITLTGPQLYYLGNKLICEDLIRNGILVSSTWYDDKGNKDRRYIYSQNGVSLQTQLYPSGAKKSQRDIFNNKEAVFYDTSGNEASYVEPLPIGGFESFEGFFNKKFHINKLYIRKNLTACITVDSSGNCSALIYDSEDNVIAPLKCEGAPKWQPATINGQPVQSTIFRSVEFNPIEYATSNDTFPVRNMRSYTITYKGLAWINTRIYNVVSADTCSYYGVYSTSGDTTILTCWDKVSGEKICRQSYVENDYGKLIKAGWFTYYTNNKKEYSELFVYDTVVQTIHYYENESPKMIFKRTPSVTYWERYENYYPSGEIKTLSLRKDEKEAETITYFDKQGNETKDVELPDYPGGEKALSKYVRKNTPMRGSKFWNYFRWTAVECWIDFYVEIDENGKLIYVGKGASSCSQTYKGIKLERWQIEELYNLLQKCVLDNPTPWKPGKINNVPTSLSTVIRVKYSYER